MNTFLIYHHGALGDFIVTWPALACLKSALPDCCFLGIGRPDYMALARSRGFIDNYFNCDSPPCTCFFNGTTMPESFGKPQGGVFFTSQGDPMVTLLKPSATLPVIAIPPFSYSHEHVASYYCAIVQRHFSPRGTESLNDYFPLNTCSGSKILIHPGSGSPAKNYSPSLYRALISEIRQHYSNPIGIILGPAEETFPASTFSDIELLRPSTVLDLAEYLQDAALYLGNDSGVSHCAGALGIPAIVMYKTTDPSLWGALGRKVVHVEAADDESALVKVRDVLCRIMKTTT